MRAQMAVLRLRHWGGSGGHTPLCCTNKQRRVQVTCAGVALSIPLLRRQGWGLVRVGWDITGCLHSACAGGGTGLAHRRCCTVTREMQLRPSKRNSVADCMGCKAFVCALWLYVCRACHALDLHKICTRPLVLVAGVFL